MTTAILAKQKAVWVALSVIQAFYVSLQQVCRVSWLESTVA